VYGIVVEYPAYGDLKHYLRQHSTTAALDATGTMSRCQTLSNSNLTLVTSTAYEWAYHHSVVHMMIISTEIFLLRRSFND